MAIWAITAVQPAPGREHSKISSIMWMNVDSGKTGIASVATMVDFIDTKGNDVRTGGEDGWAKVGVVRPTTGTPYLRSFADGTWTDNLLSLPEF